MSSTWTFALALRLAQGEETVRTTSQARKRRVIAESTGLFLMAAFLAGCGGSSDVKELPEASRKALIQRKVDVEQRPAKSSKAGQGSSKGRPPAR
jgi:hypothetical protein